jgi:uncharacterized protein
MGKRVALGLAALCLSAFELTAAQPVPSFPARHFDDRASLVSPAVSARLDERLQAFEARTGKAVYVSIFPKLPSASLEDFTVRTATAWRVGRKGVDDGAILFAFVEDRKLRLEVGYGLEGVIPDAVARRILDEHISPHLKAERPDAGFEAGVEAILAAAEGRPLPTNGGEPSPRGDLPIPASDGPLVVWKPTPLVRFFAMVKTIALYKPLDMPVGLAFLAAVVPLSTSPLLRFFPIRRRVKRGESLPRAWAIESVILLWLVVSNLSSGRGGSTTSSGRSSSGGSSGGGGRFGGGGASGSW